MRSPSLISGLFRFLLGTLLLSSMLLLPPSSAHAQSGMHEAIQASDRASHHSVGSAGMDMAPALTAQDSDLGDHENEPCCGGICSTAALLTTQGDTVTVVHSAHLAPVSLQLMSVDPRGLQRPPRA